MNSTAPTDALRFSLPSDVAADAEAQGLAVRGMPQRGPEALQVATLMLGATSTFVTVVVNRAELRKVLRIVSGKARRDAGDAPKVQVEVTIGDTVEVVVESNDDQGQQRVEVRLMDLLESSGHLGRMR